MVKYPPMFDTSVYHFTFLRHGESVGNAEDRFQGHADFPLTEKGCVQARALTSRWRIEGVTFDRCILTHTTTFATFTYEPARHTWRMLNFDDRRPWKEG